MDCTVDVPSDVRILLAHGAVQQAADMAGARVMHLKGFALDPELVWPGRVGTDVDVLVHPADLAEFLAGIESAGWVLETDFAANSSFAHAATYWSDTFGHLDVHRFFPGLGGSATEAFERFSRHTKIVEIGGVPCTVPTTTGQRLVLLLHAARGRGGKEGRDVEQAWVKASAEERVAVEEMVEEMDAGLAFHAALGRLGGFRDDPRYDLWRVAQQGGTRIDEWRARVKAAPTRWEATKVVLRAPLVNTQHLATVWGRPPTKAEIVREFFARPLRGFREEIRRRRGA